MYGKQNVALALSTGAGGTFHKQSIFEPGEPQCVNACGFLLRCPFLWTRYAHAASVCGCPLCDLGTYVINRRFGPQLTKGNVSAKTGGAG
jgi:hypothetical protein